MKNHYFLLNYISFTMVHIHTSYKIIGNTFTAGTKI